MAYEFTASRVSGDGNAVFPDKLIITDEFVIYRKSLSKTQRTRCG